MNPLTEEQHATHFSWVRDKIELLGSSVTGFVARFARTIEGIESLRSDLARLADEAEKLDADIVWLRAHVICHDEAQVARIQAMVNRSRPMADNLRHRHIAMNRVLDGLAADRRRAEYMGTRLLGLGTDVAWLRAHTPHRPRVIKRRKVAPSTGA